MSNKITEAVRILKNGGIVAFPTETVYGLGARLSDEKAVKRIFAVKGRPADNPLIIHIHDKKKLKLLAREMPQEAKHLTMKFWPGPLTLVFKKTDAVPSIVTAGLGTAAIRMPSHPVARKLLKKLNEPLAAPSANRSGRPSPTLYKDVLKELGGQVDLVLEGGKSRFGLESTVLDISKKPFKILRPGSITIEDLRKIVPSISLPSSVKIQGSASSPGMKHRHYVPHFKIILVRPNQWKKAIAKWKNKKIKIGALSLTQEIPDQKNIVFKRYFNGCTEYAKKLYANFFEAEQFKVQLLFAEVVEKKGIGLAVMDRLSRAAAIH